MRWSILYTLLEKKLSRCYSCFIPRHSSFAADDISKSQGTLALRKRRKKGLNFSSVHTSVVPRCPPFKVLSQKTHATRCSHFRCASPFFQLSKKHVVHDHRHLFFDGRKRVLTPSPCAAHASISQRSPCGSSLHGQSCCLCRGGKPHTKLCQRDMNCPGTSRTLRASQERTHKIFNQFPAGRFPG